MSRPWGYLLILLAVMLPFQNCGKPMHSSRSSDLSSTTQCKAELKAEALKDVGHLNFSCGDFNNYACERRIFSPETENLSHKLMECAVGGEPCVEMSVLQFSTAAIQASGEDKDLFKKGGAYNREEVRCHHRYYYMGIPVFEGEGDSLEEALSQAMKACEGANP